MAEASLLTSGRCVAWLWSSNVDCEYFDNVAPALVYPFFAVGQFQLKEGLGKMKAVVCLGMAFTLVGCATAQEQQKTAIAVAQCDSKKTPVEWMRCLNEPEPRIVGRETPLMAYWHAAKRQTP